MTGHSNLGEDAGTLAGVGELGIALQSDLASVASRADAVIEFALPGGTVENAHTAVEAGCAMVIGTTGLGASQRKALGDLARAGGRIVCAPNMSVGVNLLFHLSDRVASALGDDFDIEVVEMHHNEKRDAPSGTAMHLAEILAQARGLHCGEACRHGRYGNVGARSRQEIGVHALRGGDVVGDHTVIFAGAGERIELTHKASSRETFASGALRAARFLVHAKPGLYDMQDVLGLR
jgi:4-hydroxy-tetrahydrodipicolinate reductase